MFVRKWDIASSSPRQSRRSPEQSKSKAIGDGDEVEGVGVGVHLDGALDEIIEIDHGDIKVSESKVAQIMDTCDKEGKRGCCGMSVSQRGGLTSIAWLVECVDERYDTTKN